MFPEVLFETGEVSYRSTISGGRGGFSNVTSVFESTIIAGVFNNATEQYSFVIGGA